MKFGKVAFGVIAAGLLGTSALAQSPSDIVSAAPESDWRAPDLENQLYMDLPGGRIIIELRPDLAPKHVQQVRTLTRQGFYNGVAFHRVIEGFMAQGGDPTGTGRGGSDLPNIEAEFTQDLTDGASFHEIGRGTYAPRVGFKGPVPVGAQPATLSSFLVDDRTAMWGMHCPGVMSMARAGDPNSANSQFFLMFGDRRDGLDQQYTVWGRVIDGFENTRRIDRGEPPNRPTPIVRMRVAADVPVEERDDVQVLRTDSETFASYLKAARRITDDGYVDDICTIRIPARVNGEIEL